jgi:hypothetical protein
MFTGFTADEMRPSRYHSWRNVVDSCSVSALADALLNYEAP